MPMRGAAVHLGRAPSLSIQRRRVNTVIGICQSVNQSHIHTTTSSIRRLDALVLHVVEVTELLWPAFFASRANIA